MAAAEGLTEGASVRAAGPENRTGGGGTCKKQVTAAATERSPSW